MSQPEHPQKAGATFLWVLGAFAGFAVLFSVLQSTVSTPEDPRVPERLAAKEEITKLQDANLTAMGLKDAAKKAEVFNKALTALKAKPVGASTQVVPGSPTQLKQAAAAAPPPLLPPPAAPPAAPAK
jgi:hypothetical protein